MMPRRRIKSPLESLPNIGPATATDLHLLGITAAEQLKGRDPWALYEDLCRITGQRHDPCVLDVFIATIRFVEGAPALPWWHYTAERKQMQQRRKQSRQ